MLRVSIALALLCSVSALLITLWIVVPAPTYALYLVSVGASEWSLWFGLLGLLGAGLGAGSIANGGRGLALLAVLLGGAAVALAAVPPVQALGVAREQGVALSLGQYISGQAPPNNPAPATVTFATVDGQPLMLDVFLPSPSVTPRPAVIVVHGGSWGGGDKTDFPRWDRWLVAQGYAVFDIQYRLEQPNWQTATGDVKCAIGWVRRNAAQYNVDPERLALLGRSAGGHLALLAAYTPDEPSLPPSCAAPATGVRAVVSFYGPADLVWGYNNPARPDVIDGPATLRRFLGGDPQSAAEPFRIASPVNHVGPATPPTLLLHGGRDQLVGQHHAEILAERLLTAGVPHATVFIPYARHGFDYNFNGWSSQIAQPVIREFLERYVKSS